MKAAVFYAPHDLRVEERPAPEPAPGEVRVAVRETGVCAGDMYIYLGKNPYTKYPQIGGHEIAGVVDRLGEGVSGLRPGDPVVVEPFVSCGRCYPCRIGKSNCCVRLEIIGAHRPGGFAEYVLAPARLVHRIPDELSFDMATFTEPVAIAVQASRRAQIAPGELVIVLGCGPIGLAVIETVRAKGARAVGVDVVAARLDLARRLGAEAVIDASGTETLQAVLDLTEGEGAPVVVEATGNPKVMESTADLVAAGGRICILGLVAKGVQVSFPGLDFTRKEMTIVGSRASVGCFPEAISLLNSGKITYPQFAVRRSMWEAGEVFKEMEAAHGDLAKVVLRA